MADIKMHQLVVSLSDAMVGRVVVLVLSSVNQEILLVKAYLMLLEWKQLTV